VNPNAIDRAFLEWARNVDADAAPGDDESGRQVTAAVVQRSPRCSVLLSPRPAPVAPPGAAVVVRAAFEPTAELASRTGHSRSADVVGRRHVGARAV